ncbi:HIT domain-containing protein [Patescibacteria group bacterium]|nr:HIT domain-containing protein [Patescibacteria group bacterium]
MQYRTFLKNSDDGCPFCEREALDRTVIVRANTRAMLTVAKAPYVADQLLVIPKRHVKNVADLQLLDIVDCIRLIRWAGKRLTENGHPGYTILLRDGDGVGKSISHLHIHVIPDVDIPIVNSSQDRRVLTAAQIQKIVRKLQGN